MKVPPASVSPARSLVKAPALLLVLVVLFGSILAFLDGGWVGGTQPAAISFEADIRPLLASRCGRCHLGDFPSADLDMGSYESLLAGSDDGPVIVPGRPGSSLLVDMVKSGEMPRRGPRLTTEEIRLIEEWIEAGAPDN